MLRTHPLDQQRIQKLQSKLPKARTECEKAKAAGKQPNGQARAAGLPLAVSRMPATMLLGTGSKRNGSIE